MNSPKQNNITEFYKEIEHKEALLGEAEDAWTRHEHYTILADYYYMLTRNKDWAEGNVIKDGALQDGTPIDVAYRTALAKKQAASDKLDEIEAEFRKLRCNYVRPKSGRVL